MEQKSVKRIEWRKLVKKLQRKRRRQKAAQDLCKRLEEEERAKGNDPVYQEWLKQQPLLEECQRLAEERQREADAEAWLRRELIAQQQFRLEQQRRQAEEAAQETIREQQQKELDARKAEERKRVEAKRQQAAEAAAEFERTMQRMEEFLADPDMQAPPELRCYAETRAGQKLCEFFERTNCCRFGFPCVFNHRRPLLSSIIVIRNFFAHPLLDQAQHHEYASGDAVLESSEDDLRRDYDEFFHDVVPEMERFGRIVNFRTVRNVLPYLRGHVFVEYAEERSALKAFINLQGRYYATKRLNVEFSNLRAWRGAVCGLSLTRKCPKGQQCAYLHLLRNPANKYNTPLEYTKSTPSSAWRTPTPRAMQIQTPLLSWNDLDKGGNGVEKSRNWRWSESPEVEMPSTTETARREEEKADDARELESKATDRTAKRQRKRSRSSEHHRKRRRTSDSRDRDKRKKRKKQKKSKKSHKSRTKSKEN